MKCGTSSRQGRECQVPTDNHAIEQLNLLPPSLWSRFEVACTSNSSSTATRSRVGNSFESGASRATGNCATATFDTLLVGTSLFFDCLQPGLLQRRAVVVEVCVSTQDPCLYIESICRIDFVCREWPWVRQGTLRVVAGESAPAKLPM